MPHQHPHKQQGVVLIIALIVLVAMTLASLALIRSVGTNSLIAGNLSFQQAAMHSGDTGIEAAMRWLSAASEDQLTKNDNTNGYIAKGSSPEYSPDSANDNLSWDKYWSRYISIPSNRTSPPVVLPKDAAGNTVSYIIDRLCVAEGPRSQTNCVISPITVLGTGNSNASNSPQFNALKQVYYRITVRVDGPRNTVSYVQSTVYK